MADLARMWYIVANTLDEGMQLRLQVESLGSEEIIQLCIPTDSLVEGLVNEAGLSELPELPVYFLWEGRTVTATLSNPTPEEIKVALLMEPPEGAGEDEFDPLTDVDYGIRVDI